MVDVCFYFLWCQCMCDEHQQGTKGFCWFCSAEIDISELYSSTLSWWPFCSSSMRLHCSSGINSRAGGAQCAWPAVAGSFTCRAERWQLSTCQSTECVWHWRSLLPARASSGQQWPAAGGGDGTILVWSIVPRRGGIDKAREFPQSELGSVAKWLNTPFPLEPKK